MQGLLFTDWQMEELCKYFKNGEKGLATYSSIRTAILSMGPRKYHCRVRAIVSSPGMRDDKITGGYKLCQTTGRTATSESEARTLRTHRTGEKISDSFVAAVNRD